MVLSDLGSSRFTFQGNGTQIALSLIDPQMTLDYRDTQIHKVFIWKKDSRPGKRAWRDLHRNAAHVSRRYASVPFYTPVTSCE